MSPRGLTIATVGHSHEMTVTPDEIAAGLRPAPLALFDLDRTLYPGSSLRPLAAVLRRRGLVGRGDIARSVVGDAKFRRVGASDAFAERVCTRALETMRGTSTAELEDVAEETASIVLERCRPSLRLALRLHQEAGSLCVLLSASPQELVAVLARRLGMYRGVGTLAEVANGRYTGRLGAPFCYGEGKLRRLEQAVGPVDLSTAWSYADSASDLPLLERCAHPVVVAPSRDLRRIARSRGWLVIEGSS